MNARWRAWWPLLCAALAGGAQAVALAWPWGVTASDWLVQRPGWLALVVFALIGVAVWSLTRI